MTALKPNDPSASRHRKGYLRTPSRQLSRGDKLQREAMHRLVLLCGLVAVLAAGVFAAVIELDAWAAWVVVAGICVTVVGVIIAISPARRA